MNLLSKLITWILILTVTLINRRQMGDCCSSPFRQTYRVKYKGDFITVEKGEDEIIQETYIYWAKNKTLKTAYNMVGYVACYGDGSLKYFHHFWTSEVIEHFDNDEDDEKEDCGKYLDQVFAFGGPSLKFNNSASSRIRATTTTLSLIVVVAIAIYLV